MNTPDSPPSFLGSFRALGDGLIATVQDRIELVSLELQEEKIRLIQIMIWITALLFSCAMAFTFLSFAFVYLFWESARLTVLGSLALFYTTAAVVIGIAFRRYLARQPRPFATTIDELKQDRACIPKDN